MPVYCITGANRGLGLEWVRQLAASDDNTIIAATRSLSSDLTALKAASSPRTHVLECDTGKVESIQAFVDAAKKVLADHGLKIDYLINNAGINSHPEQDSLTLTAETLLNQIQVNVLGPAKTVEFFVRAGLLAPTVRVVNLTSGLGSVTQTLGMPRKCCSYSISKAGLNMLSAHQAGDLRAKYGLPGAVVIVVDPGWVKTAMGGEGAVMEPEDSISNLRKLVHGLKDEDNARFFRFDGSSMGW